MITNPADKNTAAPGAFTLSKAFRTIPVSSIPAVTECINDPFENGDAVGRKVTLRGEIELPRERRNPGTFDYRM